MKTFINAQYRAHYMKGHLDYAVSQLRRFESIKDWQAWLKTEPIAYFDNKNDWVLRVNDDESGDEIVYLEGTEEEEVYDSTLVILLDNGDMLCHSAQASQSLFFDCTNVGSNELVDGSQPITAIYVD